MQTTGILAEEWQGRGFRCIIYKLELSRKLFNSEKQWKNRGTSPEERLIGAAQRWKVRNKGFD